MATYQFGGLVGDVRRLLEERCGQFMTELTDGGVDQTTDVIFSQHVTKAFQDYYALKDKFGKDSLDCAVLALAKSETARIVALEHARLESSEFPVLTYSVNGETIRVEREEHIRAHLEYLNKEVRGRKHKKDDETILTVRTELAALKHETSDLSVGLRLLDTPGPNEAGEEALKHSVERLLDSIDAVVYVLDYTKLKTKEEADLLTKLADSNPQLIQRLAQRLFFVVNKIDEMHVTEGLEEDELREYVADLVTRQMNIPSFQLRPDQVFLVSAQDALLSRLILNDKATPKQRERFAKKAFGRSWTKATNAEFIENAQDMLDESHVLELEECLLGYLYNHAGTLKLVSLLDGIVKLLTQIKNVAVTGQAAMKTSAESLSSEISQLRTSLLTTSQEFEEVRKQANAVEDDVIQSVKQRMFNLRDRLILHIDQVLDPENDAPQEPKQGGWGSILQKSFALLTRYRAQNSDSDAALKAKLSDLHGDIKKQIESEITEFWHELETSTNAKHKELISIINVHLIELARRIEGSVGKVLDLCLKPLDICLRKPSAEEFHNSIQDLLTRGIRSKTRKETKHREEDHVEWQRRWRGLCNQTEYWTGVPTKKWVAYQEEKIVFDLDPESIKAHFHTMVESSISISVDRVKEYVHAFMSDQIQQAHDKISSYSILYTDTMCAVLRGKHASEEEQKASLASIEKRIESLDSLLGEASNIAQKVSTMFPHLDMDNYEWIDGDFSSEAKPEETRNFPTNFDIAPVSPELTESQKQVEHMDGQIVDRNSEIEEETNVPCSQVQDPVDATLNTPILESIGLPLQVRGSSIIGSSSESDSEVAVEVFPDHKYSSLGEEDESEDESEEDIEDVYSLEDPDAIYDSESDDSEPENYSSEVEGSQDSDDMEEYNEDESDGDESVDSEDEDDSDDEEEDEEVYEDEEDDELDDDESDEDPHSEDESEEAEDEDLIKYTDVAANGMLTGMFQNVEQVETAQPAKIEQDSPPLSDEEKSMYPSLAESLGLSANKDSEHKQSIECFEKEIKSESKEGVAQEEVPEVKKEDMSASWTEHMTKFMAGLGVNDKNPELPISNTNEGEKTDSEKDGHFVSKSSGNGGSGLQSSPSGGDSEDWECVSETEIS